MFVVRLCYVYGFYGVFMLCLWILWCVYARFLDVYGTVEEILHHQTDG